MTAFLMRLPEGGVVAIDAPWGDGKTWFARHWHSKLESEGFRTAYIDCFQRDHVEDPFLLVAGELLELAKQSEPKARQKLMDAGKKLAVTLLPSAVKFMANAAGHWAIGNAHLGEDIAKTIADAEGSAVASLEGMVSKRLREYDADKKSVEGFRASLTELAETHDKPIIIFVDELDRCRPDFAVKTVERIKHFFDVPHVVFVLLMNRRQLVAAIEGVYGANIDAGAYLGKFIQLSLTLPKRLSVERHARDDNRQHCAATLRYYGFPAAEAADQFANSMGTLGTLFGMSLRDMERAAVLYSFAQPLNVAAPNVAWPIALKLTRPDLFKRLQANDIGAHQEAYQLAASTKMRAPDMEWLLAFFEELHNNGASAFTRALPEPAAQQLKQSGHWRNAKDYLSWLFGRVDMTVSD